MRFPDFNDDWTPFFVGDIAKLGRGRVISNKEIQIQLKPLYPVYSSQTLNNGVMGYLDTFDFEGEYITWTTDGANAGTVFYRSGKFNCTNVCGILKLKSEFSHLFCALGLQKETKKFVSTNLANPKLMNNTMAKISLSIPSLAEQKKIADFLSLIDERIQSCSETIRELKNQKAALLNQLFSQKLRFPDYSNEWTTSTISKVCKVSTGSMNTQDKVDGGDYPFYVRSSTIERTNRYTYDGIAILTPGDGAIGKIFHYSEGKIAVHQRVYILSEITIDAKYLFYYFSDKFYNRVIRMSAKNTVDSVRINMITDMPLSLPSLAEQKKIADFLSLIDERIEVEEQLLQQYEKQKRYLLRQMFV